MQKQAVGDEMYVLDLNTQWIAMFVYCIAKLILRIRAWLTDVFDHVLISSNRFGWRKLLLGPRKNKQEENNVICPHGIGCSLC